jgi:hypothetical protein
MENDTMYEPMKLDDLETDRKAIKAAIDKACDGEHPLAAARALFDKLDELAAADASVRMRVQARREHGESAVGAAISEATKKKH